MTLKFSERIDEIMRRQEDLVPELAAYVEQGKMFKMIRHPLVFAVPYNPQLNAMLNESLKVKTEYAKEMLKKGDFSGYVFLHERPYRINAFNNVIEEHGHRVTDADYWDILSDLWRDSENIWQNQETWYDFLTGDRKGMKQHFMNEEDRATLNKMPDRVTLYRGCMRGKNELGFSYTTDLEKAKWFAQRFCYDDREPIVRVIEVRKRDIVAYTDQRSEKECIVLKPTKTKRIIAV